MGLPEPVRACEVGKILDVGLIQRGEQPPVLHVAEVERRNEANFDVAHVGSDGTLRRGALLGHDALLRERRGHHLG